MRKLSELLAMQQTHKKNIPNPSQSHTLSVISVAQWLIVQQGRPDGHRVHRLIQF